jgi:lipid A 3-O-deacylase
MSHLLFANISMENRGIRLLVSRVSMLLVISLFSSCQVFAQDTPPSAEKGRWDFSVWVAGETGEENTNSFAESQIWSAGIFVGRVMTRELSRGWMRGNIEYAADFAPAFETYGNQRTHGVGFDPVILRWNSALHTPRISPYIELAGGAVITPTNLPPGNTSSFNFTAKGGGGIYLWTLKRQALDLGCRWSHISNANLGVQNPEFNGVQFTLAYHWFK